MLKRSKKYNNKKMKIPFTPLEVTNSIKKLKYNKIPGIDNIRAEHLNNGPIEELSK